MKKLSLSRLLIVVILVCILVVVDNGGFQSYGRVISSYDELSSEITTTHKELVKLSAQALNLYKSLQPYRVVKATTTPAVEHVSNILETLSEVLRQIRKKSYYFSWDLKSEYTVNWEAIAYNNFENNVNDGRAHEYDGYARAFKLNYSRKKSLLINSGFFPADIEHDAHTVILINKGKVYKKLKFIIRISGKYTIDKYIVKTPKVKKGYRFVGWYSKKNGKGIEYINTNCYDENVARYAKKSKGKPKYYAYYEKCSSSMSVRTHAKWLMKQFKIYSYATDMYSYGTKNISTDERVLKHMKNWDLLSKSYIDWDTYYEDLYNTDTTTAVIN